MLFLKDSVGTTAVLVVICGALVLVFGPGLTSRSGRTININRKCYRFGNSYYYYSKNSFNYKEDDNIKFYYK